MSPLHLFTKKCKRYLCFAEIVRSTLRKTALVPPIVDTTHFLGDIALRSIRRQSSS